MTLSIRNILLAFSLLILVACKPERSDLSEFCITVYAPKYSQGFEILGAEGKESTIIRTKCPWQGAEDNDTYLFIKRNGEEVPRNFNGQIINGEAKRIVCMSSSYIAMLDLLSETDRVVGVSGIDFITNPKIQAKRDIIGDIGYDNNTNYELLIGLKPDLVLLYGVRGANIMESKLKELGIPFAYIGEYLEQSPLGKAEWVVALAEITGCREKGIETYNVIPTRYNEMKQAVENLDKPKVMINTPYRDSWVMASTGSYVAQLISDAGGDYVYTANCGTDSKAIDLEEAYMLASTADCWINLGALNSREQLCREFPKFAHVKPVETGQIYNSNLRINNHGGNDYWESGVVHPELVLQDLIKIFHPELLKDAPFTYYKPL